MTTLLACTFIGYAPGFGVGLAAAAVMYLLCGIADTVSTSTSVMMADVAFKANGNH